MANPRAPGVTITERDISEVLVPAGTSIGALVGGAYTGPTNQRVLITNDKEFVQTFGVPKKGSDSEFTYYAALEFLKESGFLWFTRATVGTDTVGFVTSTSAGVVTEGTVTEKSSTALLAIAGYKEGNTPIKYESMERAAAACLTLLLQEKAMTMAIIGLENTQQQMSYIGLTFILKILKTLLLMRGGAELIL